jgi:hypothetical protein
LKTKTDLVSAISSTLTAELNKIELKKLSQNPTTPMLLIESINVEEVSKWIESKHCQEFGRFSVKNDEERDKIARWLIEQIRNFYKYKANNLEAS